MWVLECNTRQKPDPRPWLEKCICGRLSLHSNIFQCSYPLGSCSWRGQACGQGGCWSRHRWPVSGAEPGTGPAPGPEGTKAWLGTYCLRLSSTPLRGLLLSRSPWTYHRGPSASAIHKRWYKLFIKSCAWYGGATKHRRAVGRLWGDLTYLTSNDHLCDVKFASNPRNMGYWRDIGLQWLKNWAHLLSRQSAHLFHTK